MSPALFKLVTYKIIKKLNQRAGRVRIYFIGCRQKSSLFFADDGLLLANAADEARETVEVLRDAERQFGLEINLAKSKCVIFNSREDIGQIAGMGVVNEIRYMEVEVENNFGMFEKHRRMMIKEGRKFSNLTYSVVEKSCLRLVVGKVYWKGDEGDRFER